MTSKEIQDAIIKIHGSLGSDTPFVMDLTQVLMGLNDRLDKLESRLSTVQDDILRVEKETQNVFDRMLPKDS